MSKKRERKVSRSFEVDRLAEKNLIAAYEYLVPVKIHLLANWSQKQGLKAKTTKREKEK